MLYELMLSWRLAPQASPQHVTELFKRARRRSEQWALTGLLVYDGDCLVSHLEGQLDDLTRVSRALGEQRAFVDLKVQHQAPLAQRAYADFRTGYAFEDEVRDFDSSLSPLTELSGDNATAAFRRRQGGMELD